MEFFSILLPLLCLYFYVLWFFSVAFVVVRSNQTRNSGLLHPFHSVFTLSPSVHHCAAPLASLQLVGFLRKLDLASSINFPPSHVIPPYFLASQLPNTTSFGQIRHHVSARGSHLLARLRHVPASVRQTLLLDRCFYFLVFLLLLCFVGYYLPTFYWFVSLAETFVTEFVLVHLFTTVLVINFSSAFIALASFRRLLLVTSGGS